MSETVGKAQIQVGVDGSGVETGLGKIKKSLRDLGVAASDAGKQASEGLSGAGNGGQQAAGKIDAATKNIIGSIQRTTAAMDAGGKSTSRYFELLANQRGVSVEALKPYLAQLDAVAAKQGIANRSIEGTTKAFSGTNKTAREIQFALRGVPAQFTDIATSLAAGQRPLQVFLQQGGQLKDMFGGVGPAARALGGYIVGLINPFTIAAAAAGVLALALAHTESVARSLSTVQAQLTATGRGGLFSNNELLSFINELSQAPGVTRSSATQIVSELSKFHDISGGLFRDLSRSVADYAKATGTDVPTAAKALAAAFADPEKGAKQLDDALGRINSSQLLTIERLAKSGDIIGAQRALYEALQGAVKGLNDNAMTPLQKSVNDLGNAWEGAMQALDKSDGLRTINSLLADTIDLVSSLIKSTPKVGGLGAIIAAGLPGGLTTLISRGIRSQFGSGSTGGASGDFSTPHGATGDFGGGKLDTSVAADDDIKRALKSASAFKSQASQIAELVQQRAVFNKALKESIDLYGKESEQAQRLRSAIAGVNERIANLGKKSSSGTAEQLRKAQLAIDIEGIQNSFAELSRAYANSEKVLEAVRAAGIISDRQYFELKRGYILAESDVEEQALQKQIDRLQQEKFTGKDKAQEDARRLENAKKIAEAEAKLAILRADSSSKIQVLNIQEEASIRRLALAYLTARQAAQDYFDSIERQQNRELSGIGQGTQQRNFNSGINQIEDRYQQQRRDLENQKAQLELEGKFTDEARKQYEERKSIIDEFQQKSIASFTRYYSQLLAKQADFRVGATEALRNYITDSENIASQTEALFNKSFQGMEDALVQFVTTGKLSFKSLANSIVADIDRIIIKQQITKPLAEWLLGGATGGGFAGSIFSGLGILTGAGSPAQQLAAGTMPLADGTNYVPRDGFLATLHEGEAVVPKKFNPAAGGQPSTTTSAPITVQVIQTFSPNTTAATANQAAAEAGRAVRRQLERRTA